MHVNLVFSEIYYIIIIIILVFMIVLVFKLLYSWNLEFGNKWRDVVVHIYRVVNTEVVFFFKYCSVYSNEFLPT